MKRATVSVTRTYHVEAESEAQIKHIERGLRENPGITEIHGESSTVKMVNTVSDYLMLPDEAAPKSRR